MKPTKNKESIRHIVDRIIEKQLTTNEPPETAITYSRLLEQSFSDEEARLLISRIIHIELLQLMQKGEAFNKERFLQNLGNLPELPDIDQTEGSSLKSKSA